MSVHSKSSGRVSWPENQVRLYREVGLRVREIRIAKGVTQESLAKQIALTRTSLSNIEKGRQKLLVHRLVDIASALGTPIEELFGRRNYVKTQKTLRMAKEQQSGDKGRTEGWTLGSPR